MAILTYLLYGANETFHVLFAFNIFFVCMFFPLGGPLKRKIIALVIGNILCFVWSTLFSMFITAVAAHVGDDFNFLFVVLNPLLNLLWIVSFWSISLTFLAESKRGKW